MFLGREGRESMRVCGADLCRCCRSSHGDASWRSPVLKSQAAAGMDHAARSGLSLEFTHVYISKSLVN